MKHTLALFLLPLLLTGCLRAQTGSDDKIPAAEPDLSKNENVIAELQKIKDASRAGQTTADERLDAQRSKAGKLKKENVCIERLKESANVIVIGAFRYDYGCHFEGAFVGSRYYEAESEIFELSKAALLEFGWEKADQKQRERLALAWVANGLNAFFTVLHQSPKELENAGFQPPQAVSSENGDLTVTLWVRLPRGRTKEKGFRQFRYKFKADGTPTSGTTLGVVVASL